MVYNRRCPAPHTTRPPITLPPAPDDVEAWTADFIERAAELEREYEQGMQQASLAREGASLEKQAAQYVFHPNNPFMSDMESASKAAELFRTVCWHRCGC